MSAHTDASEHSTCSQDVVHAMRARATVGNFERMCSIISSCGKDSMVTESAALEGCATIFFCTVRLLAQLNATGTSAGRAATLQSSLAPAGSYCTVEVPLWPYVLSLHTVQILSPGHHTDDRAATSEHRTATNGHASSPYMTTGSKNHYLCTTCIYLSGTERQIP